ncbi:MAG: hypothetical protein CHACPFDD_00525 [Phycisphaerae bacterium]|nr:hypothetical protein [Phycisphaerae bacterium]
MIRETTIDSSLNRLMRHFGHRIVARPPARPSVLAGIEQVTGALPRDLVIFLSTCDGFHLDVPETPLETRFCTSEDILRQISDPDPPAAPQNFVPVRCDRAGQDWLVLDEPPMHGLVLRWDPGTHGGQVVASCFGAYLDAWSRYLVEALPPAGKRPARKRLAKFDSAYVAQFDPEVRRLARLTRVRRYVAELEVSAACGDDFE